MFMDYKTNIVKIPNLTQMIYRFDTNPIKTPRDFFVESEKLIPKCI